MSVLKSLWDAGVARQAVLMADYAVNPLGVKSDAAIATVVERWIEAALIEAELLIFACNTLSIRYHQLADSRNVPGLSEVISMVDCFTAMIECEHARLVNQRVLIIGTAFTASQPIYSDILTDTVPGVVVSSVAATELERAIARFQPWETESYEVITSDLLRALESTDVAVLACTCFRMAMTQLKLLFPQVQFLDPGEYCARLIQDRAEEEQNEVRVRVTGDVVETQRVTDFASSWLSAGRVMS